MLNRIKEITTPSMPILLYGAPGIGKTEIIRQSFGYTEVMLVSTMVEEDISGLPYRDGDYDYRTIPAVFRRLNEADNNGKTTCLFLDELDKARRAVADTLLTLVASRKMGNGVLPDNTVIVAAANPPEFGGGDGISDAMRSRFCVIDAEPCIKSWKDWAIKKFRSPSSVSVIESIASGVTPLVDVAGEEMSKRLTCPRTLAMMLKFIEEKGAEDIEAIRCVGSGLLTQNTVSKMVYALESSHIKDRDVFKKSANIKMSAVSSAKKHQPLRV